MFEKVPDSESHIKVDSIASKLQNTLKGFKSDAQTLRENEIEFGRNYIQTLREKCTTKYLHNKFNYLRNVFTLVLSCYCFCACNK